MRLAKAISSLGAIAALAAVFGVGTVMFGEARSRALPGVAPGRIAVLTITFDDALRSSHLHGFPVLQQYGLRGTTFLTTAFMSDTAGTGFWAAMTWDEAAEWLAAGWEIGAHTETHRGLPTLTDVELKSELAFPALRIHQELGVLPTSFSAPMGMIDDRTRAMIESTFDAHVRTRHPSERVHAGLNHMPPADRYDISRYEMSRDMPPSLACAKIDLAVRQGSWLVLSFHGILPELTSADEEMYFYSVEGLEEIARCAAVYLDAGTLVTATIQEVLARSGAGV